MPSIRAKDCEQSIIPTKVEAEHEREEAPLCRPRGSSRPDVFSSSVGGRRRSGAPARGGDLCHDEGPMRHALRVAWGNEKMGDFDGLVDGIIGAPQ